MLLMSCGSNERSKVLWSHGKESLRHVVTWDTKKDRWWSWESSDVTIYNERHRLLLKRSGKEEDITEAFLKARVGNLPEGNIRSFLKWYRPYKGYYIDKNRRLLVLSTGSKRYFYLFESDKFNFLAVGTIEYEVKPKLLKYKTLTGDTVNLQYDAQE